MILSTRKSGTSLFRVQPPMKIRFPGILMALIAINVTAHAAERPGGNAPSGAGTPPTGGVFPQPGMSNHGPMRDVLMSRSKLWSFGRRGDFSGGALGLSDEQRSKIEALQREQRKMLAAIRGDKALSTEQKELKTSEAMQAYEEKRREILTPEQQKIVDAAREKLKAQAKP